MNVDITGARIYFTIPIFGGIPITATIVNSLLVTLIIIGLHIPHPEPEGAGGEQAAGGG